MTSPRYRDRPGALNGLGEALIFIGVLVGLGGGIAGGLVAYHSKPKCSAGNFGGSSVCYGTTHPLLGLGAGLIAGALLQMLVMIALGAMARAVDEVRREVRRAAAAEDDE